MYGYVAIVDKFNSLHFVLVNIAMQILHFKLSL